MGSLIVLRKAHVSAYDRKGPQGTEHVGEYENKRPEARMTTADAIAGLRAHAEGLRAAVEAMNAPKESPRSTQPEPVAKQPQKAAPPRQAPQQKAPTQPQPQQQIRPPKILTGSLLRARNGASMNDVAKDFARLPISQQHIFDKWLVLSGHAAKDLSGPPVERFRAVLQDLATRLKAHEAANKKPVPAEALPTTPPAEAVMAVAKQREQETSTFTSTVDAAPEGASFTIPVASDKAMVGTWKRVTIAGESYWKKGNSYKKTGEFQQYSDLVTRQLAEGKAKQDAKAQETKAKETKDNAKILSRIVAEAERDALLTQVDTKTTGRSFKVVKKKEKLAASWARRIRLVLQKAHVKQHESHSKTGQTFEVREHEDVRPTAKLKPGDPHPFLPHPPSTPEQRAIANERGVNGR